MDERERYYYNKGKHEGFIEGMSQGTKSLAEYIMKKPAPTISIQCNGKSHLCKYFVEMKS